MVEMGVCVPADVYVRTDGGGGSSVYLSVWPQSLHSILVETKWKIDLSSSTSAAWAPSISWLSISSHLVHGHALPFTFCPWGTLASLFFLIPQTVSDQQYYLLTFHIVFLNPFVLKLINATFYVFKLQVICVWCKTELNYWFIKWLIPCKYILFMDIRHAHCLFFQSHTLYRCILHQNHTLL